jgi:hypothetical protein
MKTKSLTCSVILSLLGAAVAAKADIVTDWNTIALETIRTNRTSPPVASRNLAILHLAIYDALNGAKEPHERKYQPYLVKGPVRGKVSEEAAAAAAAHRVLVNLFPTRQAVFDAAYTAALAAVPSGKRKGDGIAWGNRVATAILNERADDGSAAVVAPPAGQGPGDWIPTPPGFATYAFPQWGFVTPFCMHSPSQFRPPGPPPLDSPEWAAEYNEVKALGAAAGSTRTEEESIIALFWADGSGTETPPGHWNSIAQDVAAARGNTTDEKARLFALLNIALADAAICAWDAKYAFNFWRPVTAIRNGDTDGNPATEPDANWSSFIVTPPFPDYVSGHSTYSGAAATILATFYGTDRIPFTTGSDALPSLERSFNSFSAAADEAAFSRLCGGIHYRSANEHGLEAGLRIGAHVAQHFLLPRGRNGRKEVVE